MPLTTSGAQLSYLWEDLRGSGKCPVNMRASADQLRDGSPIVFYEDNIESSGQAKTVLQQWLGDAQEKWFVDERHADTLPSNKIEILRRAPIKFLFVTGQRKGLTGLIEFAKETLGNNQISGQVIYPQDGSCFRPTAGVFDSRASADKARDVFRRVGSLAVADKRAEWGDTKTDNRLLGYGNSGGLTVFYYNVPASTVTALWRSCTEVEPGWMALFPRRTRL